MQNAHVRYEHGRSCVVGPVALLLASSCATWQYGPAPQVSVPSASEAPQAAREYSHDHEVPPGRAEGELDKRLGVWRNLIPDTCTSQRIRYAQQLATNFVVAVARVSDTGMVNTPFGGMDAHSGVKVVAVSGGSKRTVVEKAEKLQKGPSPGFDVRARATLIEELMQRDCYTVVERDSIDDIVRDTDSGEGGYVDSGTTAEKGNLHGVRYIIKGILKLNPRAFLQGKVTPDNWARERKGFPERTSDESPIICLLRLYSVRSGVIAATGRGSGVTRDDAIRDAVEALTGDVYARHAR